jgi:hypothetical protein
LGAAARIGRAGTGVLVLPVLGLNWDGFLGLPEAGAVAGAAGGAGAEMEDAIAAKTKSVKELGVVARPGDQRSQLIEREQKG